MNTGRPSNPFSSHLVEPDCGGYIFSETSALGSLQQILEKLQARGWRGELVGPEGAGKSTLLTDIGIAMEQSGYTVVRWRSNDEHRTLPRGWARELKSHDIVAIDGAERLWPWLLWIVRVITKLQNKGLVITTHHIKGLGATLLIEADAVALAEKIQTLTGDLASANEVLDRLKRHHGNAREVLFDLYLDYENQPQGRPSDS